MPTKGRWYLPSLYWWGQGCSEVHGHPPRAVQLALAQQLDFKRLRAAFLATMSRISCMHATVCWGLSYTLILQNHAARTYTSHTGLLGE